MPIKRPQLANNEIYHIVMRGTDGRVIYPEREDYLHFLHDLYEFNDENAVSWEFRKVERKFEQTIPRTVLGIVSSRNS